MSEESQMTNSDDRLIWIFSLLIGAVFIFALIGQANAESYTNELPSEIYIEQGGQIELTNLTNSTLTVRQNEGLFSSSLGMNGTWTANMPYGVGSYPWSDSNGKTGVIYITSSIDNNLAQISNKPVISVEDNVVSGTATPDTPIGVTVINPHMDSSTVIVKTDSEGNFEQKLNPTSEGTHNIYVTDKNRTTYTSYEVDDINRNLETRLSVLKVLESILKIIYGSE